jgi:D-glycero-alpha-D-manno-heptose-7-phosphate kinase
MDVVILVGGKGTRLGEITEDKPKPMVDVNGKPFLEHLLMLLKKQGFEDFLFIGHYKHDKIKKYFENGSDFGVKIRHVVWDKDYGTGGAIISSLDKINSEHFLVLNGDSIFNKDFNLFIRKHLENNAKHSIALKRISKPDRYGSVKIDKNNKIVNFSEKEEAKKGLINGGIYILNKKDLENYEKEKFLSLEREIFPELELHGFEMEGEFIDIGKPDSYEEFKKNMHKYIYPEKDKTIRGRVPVRISFAGGGTDVPPYPEKYGGVALNVTINKYIYGSIKKRRDNKIVLISGNENKRREYNSIDGIKLKGDMLPLKAVVKRYHKGDRGIELYVFSEVPISSGVGGSASLFVLLISLFNNYNKSLEKSQYEIAEEALKFEREDLKNPGGKQDQFAATFGGLNFIEFFKDDFVKVNKVGINQDILSELESSLLLFYVGNRTFTKSGKIIKDQTKNVERKKETLEAMHKTKELAKEMKRLLIAGNLNAFGKKLDAAWKLKKKFSSKISNPKIDKIYSEFKKLGALGGKISGAGGGGHMFIYAPLEKHYKILKKAKELKVKHIQFKFEKEGIKLWNARYH